MQNGEFCCSAHQSVINPRKKNSGLIFSQYLFSIHISQVSSQPARYSQLHLTNQAIPNQLSSQLYSYSDFKRKACFLELKVKSTSLHILIKLIFCFMTWNQFLFLPPLNSCTQLARVTKRPATQKVPIKVAYYFLIYLQLCKCRLVFWVSQYVAMESTDVFYYYNAIYQKLSRTASEVFLIIIKISPSPFF